MIKERDDACEDLRKDKMELDRSVALLKHDCKEVRLVLSMVVYLLTHLFLHCFKAPFDRNLQSHHTTIAVSVLYTWTVDEIIICDLLPQKQAELAHSGFVLAAKTFSWGSLRQTCDFSGTGLYDI